jgi:hypothetical protein
MYFCIKERVIFLWAVLKQITWREIQRLQMSLSCLSVNFKLLSFHKLFFAHNLLKNLCYLSLLYLSESLILFKKFWWVLGQICNWKILCKKWAVQIELRRMGIWDSLNMKNWKHRSRILCSLNHHIRYLRFLIID